MSSPALTTAPRTYTSLRAAWIPLSALCLAFFVEMVDNTLLTVALPTIGRDLGATTTDLQWVTGAYALTFGGLLLTAGSVADRFGRRRVLLIGLVVFGAISLAVLAVSTAGELIALRAALGLAAAAMAPITNSLVFRLFDGKQLRMRAITVMMVVGMSGFVLGPVLGGTALAAFPWEWLLVVNAPLALLACLGVRFGVPADRREDLTSDRIDLPGAAASIAAIGFACYTLTSSVERGLLSPVTIASAVAAVLAGVLFVWRERRAAEPMLDLALFRSGTIRGAVLAQLGTAMAMAAVMFGLILHFQYAYGWSPVVAGLANLPMILTMLAASPFSEWLVRRFGHRIACLVGAVFLAGSLAGLSWAVGVGYGAIALFMVTMTVGIRTVMTICAVALVDAMAANRTSMGAALNDTAQEVGTSIGTAVIGTAIALLVTVALPSGAWNPALVAAYFGGERITFAVLAVVVGVVCVMGALTLSDSHTTEEHPTDEHPTDEHPIDEDPTDEAADGPAPQTSVSAGSASRRG